MTVDPVVRGAIAVRSLTLGHRGAVAVAGLDGCFAAGSMTAIHGPNGAGKTTLLEALAGLLPPMAGAVVRSTDSRIAYLPQQSQIDRRFPIAVADLVALGTWARTGALRALGTADRDAVRAALAMLGIAVLARRSIASLSSGQFQRALFARAIVQDADIVVLDEPFNAVDIGTTGALMDVLHRLHGEGRTIVAVLHDVEQIRTHFADTLLLARRCIAWGATSRVLDAGHLGIARAFVDAAATACPS